MNANLLTLKNVTKCFSDLIYQVLRAMKKSSPYIGVFDLRSGTKLCLPQIKKKTPPIFSRLRSKVKSGLVWAPTLLWIVSLNVQYVVKLYPR